jgi:heme/copper-type cytochrome/quinol oxidase subunit 2
MKHLSIAVAISACLMVLFSAPASACPSCYGQAEGPVIDGMNNAIMAMIGIIGFVLSGFVAMFIRIGRRTRETAAVATTESAINPIYDKGVVQWKNS